MEAEVHAFILELLFPTGWRRSGELYWRVVDAEFAARRALADTARGARVLPVRVSATAVIELVAERSSDPDPEVTR
jgi:hypothetical protein